MISSIHDPFYIGHLKLEHRLIQGPLAGYSCAPMRASFGEFKYPAYAVSEMLSANDVMNKHHVNSRYLYRSPLEGKLCYQLSGNDPAMMADAAIKLQELGADLIDINCGCPMPKIRKKGAGSALLENPKLLFQIVEQVRRNLDIPLTIKIRIQTPVNDLYLAAGIEASGADALIVHARRYRDDYDVPCQYSTIATIKSSINIPVIANGDIACRQSLADAKHLSLADGFMISRAGCGKPWLFEDLLTDGSRSWSYALQVKLLRQHLLALVALEGEYQACLQGRSLLRYYLRPFLHNLDMENIYKATCLRDFFAAI